MSAPTLAAFCGRGERPLIEHRGERPALPAVTPGVDPGRGRRANLIEHRGERPALPPNPPHRIPLLSSTWNPHAGKAGARSGDPDGGFGEERVSFREDESNPVEEIAGPDEGGDAGEPGRVAVLRRVTDVGGGRQVHVVEAGELEQHPRPGLAAATAVLVPVGTEPPGREWPSELLVGPGEPPPHLAPVEPS